MNDGSCPLVSVVIPTYNRADAAVRCARSALESDYAPVEVIIVDDCSPKGPVADEVRKAFPAGSAVTVIRHAQNRRVAAARNTGARAAKGSLLLFLDDDNTLERSAIRLLVDELRRGRHAIAAPLAVNLAPDGGKRIWATSFAFNPWTTMPRNTDAGKPYTDSVAASLRGKTFESWYAPNGFMATREAYERAGGFDEWWGIMMEESDFGMKARTAGATACVVADAVTWHCHYADTKDRGLRVLAVDSPWKAYRFARNRVVFARRHYSALQALTGIAVFAPLLALCYAGIAVAHGRFDIAAAYCAGHVVGVCRVLKAAVLGTSTAAGSAVGAATGVAGAPRQNTASS